jgi:hypothetical protein
MHPPPAVQQLANLRLVHGCACTFDLPKNKPVVKKSIDILIITDHLIISFFAITMPHFLQQRSNNNIIAQHFLSRKWLYNMNMHLQNYFAPPGFDSCQEKDHYPDDFAT